MLPLFEDSGNIHFNTIKEIFPVFEEGQLKAVRSIGASWKVSHKETDCRYS
jgi:hypothetical protein